MCQLRTAIQSRAVTLFAEGRHGDVGGSGALAWAWHLTFSLGKDPFLRLTILAVSSGCVPMWTLEITSC